MSSYFTRLECAECGHAFGADSGANACPACKSTWLEARYEYEAVAPLWREGLGRRTTDLWRYAELLPISARNPEVSMGEGYTPLIRLYPYERKYDQSFIFVKDERQGPTSSFKDRQAGLAVTALKEAGITQCVLASTGNAGAAYAAYCARAGIKLWLFVTDQVPGEKLREAALYGAEVVRVSGTYDEAKAVAAEFAKRKGYHLDRGARSIPGKEAMKTLAFEIAEQLGLEFDGARGRWVSPDWYIQAVSGGIGPLGVWKGFDELRRMGLIDHMPKLGIIQAAGCAPMVEAFNSNAAAAEPVTPRTLIHVLATGDPGFSFKMLDKAVRSNGGTMLAIPDGETFAAMRRLASTAGLSVEPATAVAFAGLERMLDEGIIDPDEVVVINCSGHTFTAESHILGDQYLLSLVPDAAADAETADAEDRLKAALQTLDEQATTILLVDDNANDRRLLRKLLKAKTNYRIFEAESGKQALAIVYEQEPDLIITDLTMPGMDGVTLIEQLKWNSATAEIPIVVVTARALSHNDQEMLDRYSDSVWIKGNFDTRQLVRHVIHAIDDARQDNTQRRRDQAERPSAVTTDQLTPYTTYLIVDADAGFVSGLAALLHQTGQSVIFTAVSAREGLKLLYEHRPDILFLSTGSGDIPLPTLIEQIRHDATLRQTPIVVYSEGFTEATGHPELSDMRIVTVNRHDLEPDKLLLLLHQAMSLVG